MNFTCQKLINLFHMRFYIIYAIQFHGFKFSWRLKHDASGNIAKRVTRKWFHLTKFHWVKQLYACCCNFSCEFCCLSEFAPYWCRTVHLLHHQMYPYLWRIKVHCINRILFIFWPILNFLVLARKIVDDVQMKILSLSRLVTTWIVETLACQVNKVS